MAAASSTMIPQETVVMEDVLESRRRFFVYKKPIRVEDRYDLPTFTELHLYVVYNLALAHHLRLLSQRRRRKGQSGTWRHVLSLYKLAHSMQTRNDIGLDPTHTVALWNNLAQAFRSLRKDNKADVCWNNMLTNIVCMIDHGCVRDVECIEDFLHNISHILCPVEQELARAA
jgi:hypothetical protein